MQPTSRLIDKKIMGLNIAYEATVSEYISFSSEILDKNGFQRRKIKASGKTYELLARDLVDGCIMPPIILAVSEKYSQEVKPILDDIFNVGSNDKDLAWSKIDRIVDAAILDKELLILDGLQRTSTIESICNKTHGAYSAEQINNFKNMKIRLEIYLGLSKTGILYRMLTLNTGQTPMSFRHQLEILYHDYIDNNTLPDNIVVVRESDEQRARGNSKYKYSDVVDMFYAYSTASPMPFDKQSLVNQLKEMSFLDSYTYKEGSDDMKDVLVLYNKFVRKVESLFDGLVDQDLLSNISRPFGRNVSGIFERSQPMAGFGAEIKRLQNIRELKEVYDVNGLIDNINFSRDPQESLAELNTYLEEISQTAKKIGESQRVYFQYAFRSLFNSSSDSYLDLSRCWMGGKETYDLNF